MFSPTPPSTTSRHRLALCLVPVLVAAFATGCGFGSQVKAAVSADGVDLGTALPMDVGALDPRTRDALQDLFSAVNKAPWDPRLRSSYASMLDAIQFDDEALTTWIQAAALDLEDARALHHIGRLQAEQGEHLLAVEAFQAALGRDASYAPTRWRLGLSLLELGDWESAAEAFAAARDLAPRDPSGAAGLATVALEQGEFEFASSLLSELLIDHPEDAHISKLLASATRFQGNEAKAALIAARAGRDTRCFRTDAWERELSSFRVAFHADVEAARMQLRAGKVEAALELLEPIYAEDPAYLEVERLLVRALIVTGQTDRAHSMLLDSLLRGDNATTRVSLGFVSLIRGELPFALQCGDYAVASEPELATAHLLRARALIALGSNEEGVEALELAFEFGEESLASRLLFARSLMSQGKLERASETLNQTTRKYAASLEAWALLTEVEILGGNEMAMRRALAEVTALDQKGRVSSRLTTLIAERAAASTDAGQAPTEPDALPSPEAQSQLEELPI